MRFFGLNIERSGKRRDRDQAAIETKKLNQARDRRARQYRNAITAASGLAGRSIQGGRGSNREDSLNEEYAYALSEVIQRSQNLDVNNPDLGGFHRTRVAQVVGSGVTFKLAPIPTEIGCTAKQTAQICHQVNRLRELHSNAGGFDACGKGRSEGIQQVRAILTAFITGGCLIHRVGKKNPETGLRFSIELISAARITTPYEKTGDPKVSYGVRYTDSSRTEIVGYYVRRVAQTVGDSFVADFKWDFLPVEDCSLLEVTEMAGLDRALPLSVRVVKQLRNGGEMIENTVEGARAQSKHYAVNKCAPGSSPFDTAQDDTDFTVPNSTDGIAFADLGDGVSTKYLAAGEEFDWCSSKLPDPDFKGFMAVHNGRIARGLNASLSTFTREVSNSYSAGRMEKQQDDPIIDQLRKTFLDAWRKVNRWINDAIWLSDAAELPGYSTATAMYWCQYRATFFGETQINPVAAMQARETGMMLRTVTPQQAAEEDGSDAIDNLRQWAQYMVAREEIEKEFKLDPHSLDILFAGKAVTTDAGVDVSPTLEQDPPSPDAGGDDAPRPTKKTNGHSVNGKGRMQGVN